MCIRDRIRPGGAFAGGTNKQNNSLFIKPELDALTAEINQIKAQLSDSEAKVEALKVKRKGLQKELEDLKVDGENARLQEQKLDLEHQQALAEVEKNQTLDVYKRQMLVSAFSAIRQVLSMLKFMFLMPTKLL